MLNEIAHVGRLAADLAAQDYGGPLQVLLVDGGSTDGTLEQLHRIAARDTRFRVLGNPRRSTAAAVNIGFAATAADIVARLDAHAGYAADHVRRAVETLIATGAGGAGGPALPEAATAPLGRAIAAAHLSPFGVGVAAFRREGASGWVDTIWNGAYWRHVAAEAGPLREDLPRAEDNDFNERVRRLGYGLYLSPDIRASYRPRATLPDLWRQHLANGLGVVHAAAANRSAFRLRHLAPLLLVLALVVPLLASLAWPPAAWATAAAALAYTSGLLIATLHSARRRLGPHLLLLPLALAVIHLAYGIGELAGLSARVLRSRPSRRLEPAA